MSLVKLKNNKEIDVWVNPKLVAILFQVPGAFPSESVLLLGSGVTERFNLTGQELADQIEQKNSLV